MSGSSFKAACVQMRSGLSRAQNIADASRLIREAAKQGAQFITTPEMTTILDKKPRRLFDGLPDGDPVDDRQHFSSLAKELSIYLLIGSMPVVLQREPRKAANRAFLFGPDGELLTTYDKLHMFDVDLPGGESWKESSIYQPGQEAVTVKTPLATFGLSICYDVRFPKLYRSLAQQGAEVLSVPAAFTKQTGQAHWEALLRARAIENGAFVIAAAQGGVHEDERVTYGNSMIIDPWGKVIAHLPHDEPGICVAQIETDLVTATRQRIPSMGLEMPFKNRNI